VLIASIYEVFPPLRPMCGRQMLDHFGVQSEPPNIAPARDSPLWDGCDAQLRKGVQIEPDWDLVGQPAPNYKVDQRISW
jgi:hypothetical protein